MTDSNFDPLFGAAPEEIPLPAAPLVTVLSQVRFPEIISIRQKSFIAGFQELVREDYPLIRDEQVKAIEFDEHGAKVAVSDESVWRFIDERGTWRLTLTPSFFSLETRKYISRADFTDRLGKIIESAGKTLKPTHVTRIGMRYVDRVPLKGDATLDGMLRPEMLGLAGSSIREGIDHAISEVMCKVKEGQMLARWGLLPGRGTHDPEIMPPASDPSWFLDIDTFANYQNSPVRYESGMIRSTALALATRSYSFFRWAVTRQFLEAFGGVVK